MPETDASYCANILRRQDPDRYLTALFAPADRRPDLFSLYAFNLELARARESVSEPIMGRMRLQWWRDALAETLVPQLEAADEQSRALRAESVLPAAASRSASSTPSRSRNLWENPHPPALSSYPAIQAFRSAWRRSGASPPTDPAAGSGTAS